MKTRDISQRYKNTEKYVFEKTEKYRVENAVRNAKVKMVNLL